MPEKKTILLVDDTQTALMMTRMMLAQRGPYRFVTASNGREAVEVASRERPDLILMDVMMPEMNGIEATRAIRQVPGLTATPIIIVTTKSDTASVEAGFAAGCNDYMFKPVQIGELVRKMQPLLEGAAAKEAP